MVTDFLGGATAGSSAAAGASGSSGVSEQPSATVAAASRTEELVPWQRPKRRRQEPDFLQPSEELRDMATGARKRKRPATAAGPCVGLCEREDCKRVRSERDEALNIAEAALKQMRALRGELAARAAQAGGGAQEELAAAALQQAALAALDGREECLVEMPRQAAPYGARPCCWRPRAVSGGARPGRRHRAGRGGGRAGRAARSRARRADGCARSRRRRSWAELSWAQCSQFARGCL